MVGQQCRHAVADVDVERHLDLRVALPERRQQARDQRLTGRGDRADAQPSPFGVGAAAGGGDALVEQAEDAFRVPGEDRARLGEAQAAASAAGEPLLVLLERRAGALAGSIEQAATLTGRLHVVPELLVNRAPEADPHATGIIAGLALASPAATWARRAAQAMGGVAALGGVLLALS